MGLSNKAKLDEFFYSWATTFNGIMSVVDADRTLISTEVQSKGRKTRHGWMKQFPIMRKWINDRHIHTLDMEDYEIVNEKYESTVGIPIEELEDIDSDLAAYGINFATMAEQAKLSQTISVYNYLKRAHLDQKQYYGYDDKPMFSKTHNVGAGDTSNLLGAGDTPKFWILDTSKIVKPLIFQNRVKPKLQYINKSLEKTLAQDDVAEGVSEIEFNEDEYRVGTRARWGKGHSMWQFGVASTEDPDKDSIYDALQQLQKYKFDNKLPINIKGTVILTYPAWEKAVFEAVTPNQIQGQAPNILATKGLKVISTNYLDPDVGPIFEDSL